MIKANAVAAVIFLAVGGLFGLLVALTRWPAVHFLPADWFYLALTAHGLDVLLVWIIFFEIAVLYFASAVLLNSRLAAPRWAWTGFALMLVGGSVYGGMTLLGNFSPTATNRVADEDSGSECNDQNLNFVVENFTMHQSKEIDFQDEKQQDE